MCQKNKRKNTSGAHLGARQPKRLGAPGAFNKYDHKVYVRFSLNQFIPPFISILSKTSFGYKFTPLSYGIICVLVLAI